LAPYRRYSRTRRYAAIPVAVALLVGAAYGIYAWRQASTAQQAQRVVGEAVAESVAGTLPVTVDVTYRVVVSGSAGGVPAPAVTYTTASGTTQEAIDGDWSHDMAASTGDVLYVSVVGPAGSTVSCRIEVDTKVVASDTSEDDVAMAACTGLAP